MTSLNLKLAFLCMLALICGVAAYFHAHNLSEPVWWYWTSAVLLFAVIFAWYRLDTIERSFTRSKWLDAGVIVLPWLFVPLYIQLRSPTGKGLRESVSMFGYTILFLVVGAIADWVGGEIG
jgi:hypothetical protein